MNRYRITLITGFTAVLVAASSGQDLEQVLTEAREEISAKNYDGAREQLQLILQQNNTYAPAYFELGKIALLQDDLKGAQTNIKAAIENDPRNEEYRAEADKIAELSSAMSDARRSYDERDYMGAVARYEKVLENHPTFASAYYGMGMAFARDGDLRQAAEAFRKAQAYNPDDARYTTALRKIVADKFNEANRLLRGRDWESALEIYKEVVELDPTFEKTYYWMARSYRMLGDNEAALKTLDRAIEIKPDYTAAYVEKGNILRRDGRSEEAKAVYRQALSLDPKSDKAWVGLGAIVRSEKPAEAVEAFKSALSVNPKNGDAAEYLGEIYSDQEKWAEARKYLEQAVKLKTKDHVVAWRLALVYNALEEYEKARQMGKQSTDLKKIYEYGWYELGLAEKALGNRVAAIEAFKNALKGRDAGIRKSSQYELKQLETSSR
ncbi:MAG: tetratricopeptide repeat protein [Calditrichaeota bacterium]|nr:tetratricopeptide repeat protein [Calditrichota bacterium]